MQPKDRLFINQNCLYSQKAWISDLAPERAQEVLSMHKVLSIMFSFLNDALFEKFTCLPF